MTLSKNVGLRTVSLICTLVVLVSSVFSAETRKDWIVLYGEAGPVKDTIIAQRYALSIEGHCVDMNIIKTLNPDFKWFDYISIQDMPPVEERRSYYDSLAALDGINPETFHVHYWDYTEVSLAGTTLVCPGLANAITHEDTVNSRVPTYMKDRSRFLANLSSPYLRQYEKMWACEMISKLPYNYHVESQVGYYDGIFWDNGSHCLFNTGQIITGGQIAEHPTHANKNDAGCSGDNWWWDSGLKLFYQEFNDTLALSQSWAPDGKLKYSMPNISNAWTDDYATADVGDYFFLEFFPYWTIRGMYLPLLYTRDSLTRANGNTLLYSPSNATSVSPYEGTRTFQEGQLTNLCWYYICRSDSAYIYQSGGGYYHNPASPGWDTGVWCGAMDFNIGATLESRYRIDTTGTDGKGYDYTVYSRQYENAKVYLRPRGNYNQDVDETTTIIVELGGLYRELLPDGNLGGALTFITLRNAEGSIVVPASGDTTPPASIEDLGISPGE